MTSAGTTTPQRPSGDPLPGLTPEQLDRFEVGRNAFDRDFTPAEGLGPIFNQSSCGACHISPLGGSGTFKVLRAGRVDKQGFDPLTEFGGSLFQLEAIDEACREDPPVNVNIFAHRTTIGMMGYGLVEAIPDQAILDVRDAQSVEVRGEAHMVEPFEDSGTIRVGRFGWKAQIATVLTFSAGEALSEIGITSRFGQTAADNDPNGINPPALGPPDFCDTVPDPEDSVAFGNGVDREFIDVVTDFQRFMVQPPQAPRSGMTGEVFFNDMGCAECHHAQFTTADDPMLEAALRNRVLRPYSDFLLHDMGPALRPPAGGGDGIVQGDAGDQQIRTPPLWGLRRRVELWHDGRFVGPTRVFDAIVAHDEGFGLSQGAEAATVFLTFSPENQDLLLDFLDSLGRREFDVDGDDRITLDDFHGSGAPAALVPCYGGGPYTADHPCAIHDVDQDGDVDPDDVTSFLTVFTGARSDCNGNDIIDLFDILEETSGDANNDGVPDECEPTCHGDINSDNMIGVQDLLVVLSSWGTCPPLPDPCPGDLNNDGLANVPDLLEILGLWGPCG